MKTKYLLFVAFTALVLTGCKGKGGSSEEQKGPTVKEIADKYQNALDNMANYVGTYYLETKSERKMVDQGSDIYVERMSLDYDTGRAYYETNEDDRYLETRKYMPSANPKVLNIYRLSESPYGDSAYGARDGANYVKSYIGRDTLENLQNYYVPSDYLYMVDNPTPFVKIICCDIIDTVPDTIEVTKAEPTLTIDANDHIDFALQAEINLSASGNSATVAMDIDVDIDIKDEFVTDLSIAGDIVLRGDDEVEILLDNGFHFETTFDEEGYNEIEVPEDTDFSEAQNHYFSFMYKDYEYYEFLANCDTPKTRDEVIAILAGTSFSTYFNNIELYTDKELTILFEGYDEALLLSNNIYVKADILEGYSWVTYLDIDYDLSDSAAALTKEEHKYLKDNNILFKKEVYVNSKVFEIGDDAPTYSWLYYQYGFEFYVDDVRTYETTFEVTQPYHLSYSIAYYYGNDGYSINTALDIEEIGFFGDHIASVGLYDLFSSTSLLWFKVDSSKLTKGTEISAYAYHVDYLCNEQRPVGKVEQIIDFEAYMFLSADGEPVTVIPTNFEGYVYFGVRYTAGGNVPDFTYLVIG